MVDSMKIKYKYKGCTIEIHETDDGLWSANVSGLLTANFTRKKYMVVLLRAKSFIDNNAKSS